MGYKMKNGHFLVIFGNVNDTYCSPNIHRYVQDYDHPDKVAADFIGHSRHQDGQTFHVLGNVRNSHGEFHSYLSPTMVTYTIREIEGKELPQVHGMECTDRLYDEEYEGCNLCDCPTFPDNTNALDWYYLERKPVLVFPGMFESAHKSVTVLDPHKTIRERARTLSLQAQAAAEEEVLDGEIVDEDNYWSKVRR